MNSNCTKGMLLLAVALLLLGAAACTQSKPVVPTPTLVVVNVTPLLPAAVSETPAPQGTPPEAVSTVEPTSAALPGGPTPGATEVVGPPTPEPLATPTSQFAPAEQTPAAEETPAEVPTEVVPTTAANEGVTTTTTGGCPNPYTVQRGEWLYEIARKCGVSAQALIAANPGINPNIVYPGQVLRISGGGTVPGTRPPATGQTYVVRRGDTMFSIATRFGTTVSALMRANDIANPNFIFVGQVLIIP